MAPQAPDSSSWKQTCQFSRPRKLVAGKIARYWPRCLLNCRSGPTNQAAHGGVRVVRADHEVESTETNAIGLETRYLSIADELRRRIERGELAPGAKVPSTRRIAAEWASSWPRRPKLWPR
ncbi:GntR family transcriptional regulator [Saccharopolyspora sp. NPDC000995]